MFCRVCSHNDFQFFVALLKRFPTSSNSLKNAMGNKEASKLHNVASTYHKNFLSLELLQTEQFRVIVAALVVQKSNAHFVSKIRI